MTIPFAAIGFALAVAVAGDAGIEPLPSELEERIAVRLVLIDVVVTDRGGEPVVGLQAEDFDVRLGGRRVPVSSFDSFCEIAAATERPIDEPVAGSPGPAPTSGRVALIFDYDHMHNAAETIEQAIDAVAAAPPGVPHMVLSIGDRLRIEQPFDADRERTLATLARMRDDRDLWAAHGGRLLEKRFFERLLTLFDLFERPPGRTTAVLYSGPFRPDGFTYDTTLLRVAARAARTRTALYTIDSGGLRTALDPQSSGLGGPIMLRRLAHATGGRPTSDTNDLSVAYRRAVDALRCSYTLGVQDAAPRPGRRRRVRVDVWRPGHRVAHPSSYLEQTPAARRRAQADAALVAPQLFAGDGLDAEARVVDDRRARRAIELSARVAPELSTGADRRLRASVRTPNGTTIRRVRLDEQGRATLRLRRGTYELIVVLSDDALDEPRAVRQVLVVP